MEARRCRLRPEAATRLTRFLLLVPLLSAPLWIIGWSSRANPLPGGLPLSALMFVAPAVAGLLLSRGDGGGTSARILLGRFQLRVRQEATGWWVLSILALPVVLVVSHWSVIQADEVLGHGEIPPIHAWAVVLVLFYGAAAIEEIGWSAFATEDAVALLGEVGAGVVLGAAWALWHVVPWLQMGHSVGWVSEQAGFTIVLRTLQVLVFTHTSGSALAATNLHATANLSLLPSLGADYDPGRAAATVWPRGRPRELRLDPWVPPVIRGDDLYGVVVGEFEVPHVMKARLIR